MHVLLLPQTSVAVEVTVVIPIGNILPDAGELVIVTGPAQLSVAVTANVTTAVHEPTGVVTVIGVGQVITGAV